MSTTPTEHREFTVPYAPLAAPDRPWDRSDRFVGGRPHEHANGALTRYADDKWIIVANPLTTISFADLPGWLKEPMKHFIAARWLDEKRSLGALATAISRARWWASTLGEAVARDLRDLTPEHAQAVRKRLEAEKERARTTIEAASLAKGARLSDRERKQLVKAAGGRMQVGAVATEIDMICAHVREAFGWRIPFVVGRIKRAKEDARGPMSADKTKVLSREQRAALVRVLDHDIRRYWHARELLEWSLSALPVPSVPVAASRARAGRRARKTEEDHKVGLMVDCYLGINGREMHSAAAVGAKLGYHQSSAGNVSRTVKRRLAKSLDAATLTRLLALRQQIAYRKHDVVGGDPVREAMVVLLISHGLAPESEPRHGLRVVRGEEHSPTLSTEASTDGAVRAAEVEMRALRAYCGLEDGITCPVIRLNAIFGYAIGNSHGYIQVRNALRQLVGPVRARRVVALRNALDGLWSNAIKATALKLQLAASRRIAALVSLDAEPKIEILTFGGDKTAVVHFRAWKGWGDQGAPDPTPCPDDLADLAVGAIADAQTLTSVLRPLAHSDDADRLFLLPDRNRTVDGGITATPLSHTVLATWLYNDEAVRQPCLLDRYATRLKGVGGLRNFSSHHARQTNATHMMEGGAALQTAGRFLGHNLKNGNSVMAGTFYVAGDTEPMRERIVDEVEKLQGTGHVYDAVLRVQLAAAGPGAQQDHPGPMELSLDAAIERLREADILVAVPYDAAEARRLLRAGKVVHDNGLGGCVVSLGDDLALLADGLTIHATRRGGCLLPAEDGACPAGGEDCSVGVEPEHPSVKEGKGCKWSCLLPCGVRHLETQLEILDAQIGALDGVQGHAQWRVKLEGQRAMKRREIALARRSVGEVVA